MNITMFYVKDEPFGGKIILLSGDFRQILPVEKNPFDSCNTCLKTSYLWDVITQLRLTINERVRQFGGHKSYATFLMYLGLGLLKPRSDKLHYKFKEYSDEFIRLPRRIGTNEIIQPYESMEHFTKELFPNLENSEEIPETIILTPKNVNMYEINKLCIERYKPDLEPLTLKSVDEPYIPEQEGIFPEDIMNQYNPGSLPQHEIMLKPGCPLMLLRNVNLFEGLANGTRLKLLEISDSGNVMKVEVMTGPKAAKDSNGKYIFSKDERVFPLFKIPCSNENDNYIKMIRRQFPVRLTYCMSINKAQGQTLKKCGLYLPAPVFSHGQLYVAMSRVSSPENITVYIDGSKKTHGRYGSKWYTKNVVYTQLLRKETNAFQESDAYIGEVPKFVDGPESDSETEKYEMNIQYNELEYNDYNEEVEEEPDFHPDDFELDENEPDFHPDDLEIDDEPDIDPDIFYGDDEPDFHPDDFHEDEEPDFHPDDFHEDEEPDFHPDDFHDGEPDFHPDDFHDGEPDFHPDDSHDDEEPNFQPDDFHDDEEPDFHPDDFHENKEPDFHPDDVEIDNGPDIDPDNGFEDEEPDFHPDEFLGTKSF